MTLKLNGTNSEAAPAYAGDDADTGLQCGTNELKLVTGGSARATVDSAGRLLVGTTANTSLGTDSYLAQVKALGADAGLGIIRTANSVAPPFFSLAKSRNDGIVQSGDGLGKIQFIAHDGTDYNNVSALINAEVDGTPGNNDVPGRLMFWTTADGASSPTERLRITSNGTIQLRNSPGIDFSQIQTNASGMTSETLDSYEEGTWTPTINTTTTPITGITYTRQAGYYTKIGNVCHVSMWITWSARTNTSGTTASISLPFTSKNAGEYRGAMHVSTENCTYNGYGFDSGSTRNIGAMAGTHLNQNVAYMEISFTGKNGGGWGSGGISVNGLGASGGNMQLAGTYLVQ